MPNPDDSTSTISTAHPPGITLDIVHDAGAWSEFGAIEALIAAAGEAVGGSAGLSPIGPCEACVALSDDAGVRKLNAAYRAKDKPTNVLSFPAPQARPSLPGEPRLLGDVVLAEETLLSEAHDLGIDPQHHLQHLVVHGLLHLLGYDHETSEEASAMEALEVEILSTLGISNPYADAAGRALPLENERSRT